MLLIRLNMTELSNCKLNGAVTLRLRQKNGSIKLPHFIFGFDGGLVRFLSIFVTLFVIREFQVTAVQLQREEKDAYVVSR